MYLRYALLFPLMIVFCLPRMHERYFYLADAMAIAAAAEDRRMTPAVGLIALASLGSYWETALPLSACCMDDVCGWNLDDRAYPTGRKIAIIREKQQNVTLPGAKRSAGTFSEKKKVKTK